MKDYDFLKLTSNIFNYTKTIECINNISENLKNLNNTLNDLKNNIKTLENKIDINDLKCNNNLEESMCELLSSIEENIYEPLF